MKIDVPKPKVKSTITLEEDELVWLAQLAGQVSGDSPRSKFYGLFHREVWNALQAIGHELPVGRDHFAVVDGRLWALPMPEQKKA